MHLEKEQVENEDIAKYETEENQHNWHTEACPHPQKVHGVQQVVLIHINGTHVMSCCCENTMYTNENYLKCTDTVKSLISFGVVLGGKKHVTKPRQTLTLRNKGPCCSHPLDPPICDTCYTYRYFIWKYCFTDTNQKHFQYLIHFLLSITVPINMLQSSLYAQHSFAGI